MRSRLSPSQFSIEVTTDMTFDVIEVQVDGHVANGLNIVPINVTTGERQYTPVGPLTLLSPLGSPLTDGVFEPGINADIDLTYGVTSPVPGQWTFGLTDAPFLQFDLLSGVASVTVNLLLGGGDVATQQVSVVAVPEANTVLCWSLLGAGTVVACLRRRSMASKRGQ